MIELRDIHKSFFEGTKERPVFSGLDARFPAGIISVVTGRSGTGKTTLLNLISGIDLPDAGEVAVNGSILNTLPDRQRTIYRRHSIGFVFQFFNLIPTLNVEENLLLPLELLGQSGPAARRQAEDFLSRVGLRDRRDSYPDRLSGGEQQRVAICRALIHDPELLLVDEPTGNLDAETGRSVLELLATLVEERQKTVVMVTHSSEAMAFGQVVFNISAGQLTQTSPGE
ncbi:MAG: ABC transporter ATP-binding protein [Gammaproteobacteria bacterium]|nr:MAG: ABC transporter ATP-binding protein [Gammaproteobacteria bacterium]